MSKNKSIELPLNGLKGISTRFFVWFTCMLFVCSLFFSSVAGFSSTGFQYTSISPAQGVNFQTVHSTGFLLHNAVRQQNAGLVMEIVSETEQNAGIESSTIDFHNSLAYHIHDYVVSHLEKKLSTLPSLFFQKKERVPFFILFHSWKNYLPEIAHHC